MLIVSDLFVSFGKKTILKGISFRIDKSEIHVLMGPNGSGKSTLGQVIMGNRTYKITNKENIKLNSKSITNLPPEERAKMGLFLAFQNPVAIPGVSVANFLRSIKKIDNKNLSAIVDFNKKLEKKCAELNIDKSLLKRSLNDGFSGGEKKKIEMLQMVLMKPKYAVIDEVDTGLDIDALKTVALSIEKLRSEGAGIILITHNPHILHYFHYDCVHLLVKGKIVKSGGKQLVREIEEKGYSQIN